jgi:hypothetical protein
MSLTKVTYAMIDGAMVNVLDYGAVGDNSTDCTTAIQAAVDTGLPVFFPSGVYKITAPIVSTGLDFVIVGETFNAMSEKNNEEDNFTGSVINYFGPDAAYPIDVVNTVDTNQICIQNLTIVAARTHQFGIVRLKGDNLTGLEYASQVTMQNVRIQTRDFNVTTTGLNGITATALVIDCTAGWFFGSAFTNIYIFGVQTGILVAAGGGFFNSNTFTNIKQYQVWRALELTTQGVSGSQIYANLFDGLYVQPNSQNGIYASGIIRCNGDVTQNVFIAPNVYDVPIGDGPEYATINNGVRWGLDNIFIGPQGNNIFSDRTTNGNFPGWGVNSFGQSAVSALSIYMADPTIKPDETAIYFFDQSAGSIRYLRNGLANDVAIYTGGNIRAALWRFSGTFLPVQMDTTTASAFYEKGAIYFDTTLNKLRVGGATGWETITST